MKTTTVKAKSIGSFLRACKRPHSSVVRLYENCRDGTMFVVATVVQLRPDPSDIIPVITRLELRDGKISHVRGLLELHGFCPSRGAWHDDLVDYFFSQVGKP